MWTEFAQRKTRISERCCEHGHEPSGFFRCGEFIQWLGDCQLLKRDCADLCQSFTQQALSWSENSLLANRPYPEPSHTSQIYIFLLRSILILFSSIYTKASQAVLHRVSLHDCDAIVPAGRHNRLMLLQYTYRSLVCFNHVLLLNKPGQLSKYSEPGTG